MSATFRSIPMPRRPRRAGAFTLLEILLAVVLGALLLSTALGVFYSLQRSGRHNEDRLRNAMELSMTQRAVELTLRTMILSNTHPPTPAGPVPADRATQPGAPPVADATTPPEDTPFERPRVILSRDGSLPLMHWINSQGRDIQIDPQRLEITVERPPVFPLPLPGENFTPVVHRMYASRHQRDREQRAERLRNARENATDDPNADTQSDAANPDTEPAIAAGVRGAFGLTWELDHPRPGEAPNPDGGSWSLWWRTLPPIVSVPNADATEGLSDDDLDNNPMYRPVLLAANLRWCKWEAVRAGETLSEFTSTWWEDLPAYVTLEIQTVSGKWSKWMFEVQGTRGPEPGTAIGDTGTNGDQQQPNDAAAAAAAALGEQLGVTPPTRGNTAAPSRLGAGRGGSRR